MQNERNSLSYRELNEDIATLANLSLPGEPESEKLLLFGGSPRCFYLSFLECDEDHSIGRLCYGPDTKPVAAFYLSLSGGSLFLKRASLKVTREQLLEILSESFRILIDRSDSEFLRVSTFSGNRDLISLLETCGFAGDLEDEVLLTRELEGELPAVQPPAGIVVRAINVDSRFELDSRARAQGSAFSGRELIKAGQWDITNIERMTAFSGMTGGMDLVAVKPDGIVASFAGMDFDRKNFIGEFDPVGTLPTSQRTGIAKSIMVEGLRIMRSSGLKKAVVRTSSLPATRLYESVGFKVSDRSICYRKKLSND